MVKVSLLVAGECISIMVEIVGCVDVGRALIHESCCIEGRIVEPCAGLGDQVWGNCLLMILILRIKCHSIVSTGIIVGILIIVEIKIPIEDIRIISCEVRGGNLPVSGIIAILPELLQKSLQIEIFIVHGLVSEVATWRSFAAVTLYRSIRHRTSALRRGVVRDDGEHGALVVIGIDCRRWLNVRGGSSRGLAGKSSTIGHRRVNYHDGTRGPHVVPDRRTVIVVVRSFSRP